MDWLSGFIHKLLGWKIVGQAPIHLKKGIWTICPHWTNWDFPIGPAVRSWIGINIGYLAKHSLFQWYSAWFFKALGGYPVNRKKANNLVEAVANTFNQNESIHIAITPEGTRSNVSKLKTGFYYIALRANIPIITVGFDQKHKETHWGDSAPQ